VRVGIDLVSVATIRRVFERDSDTRLRQVFAPSEIRYCRSRNRVYESLAARFAAKESFVKAIGACPAGAIRLTDVVVSLDAAGHPHLELGDSAARAMRALGLSETALSLSHLPDYAVACVLLT
jgi:holo-[acyl-carrier protein] synthase